RNAIPRNVHRGRTAPAWARGRPLGVFVGGRTTWATGRLARGRLEGLREGSVRTEHGGVHQLVPPTDVVGREQRLDGRQVVGRLRGLRRVDRTRVRARGEDLLRFLRVEVLDELIGDVGHAVLRRVRIDDHRRRSDLDRRGRFDEL